MKNYITPCVNLVTFREDIITTSNNYIEDNFNDIGDFSEA